MTDEEIDFSDIPELTEEDFRQMKPSREFFAERGIVYNPAGPHYATVHHEDGTATRHVLSDGDEQSDQRRVTLAPDVSRHFADSDAVSRALRALLRLQRELA